MLYIKNINPVCWIIAGILYPQWPKNRATKNMAEVFKEIPLIFIFPKIIPKDVKRNSNV